MKAVKLFLFELAAFASANVLGVCLGVVLLCAAINAQASPAALYIEVQSDTPGEQGLARCSGTAVARNVILTAQHCVAGARAVSVDVGGKVYPVQKQLSDSADHVLLVLPGQPFKAVAKLSLRAPKVGDAVSIVGNPGPLRSLLRRGYAAGRDNLAVEGFAGSPVSVKAAQGAMLYDLNGFFGDSGSGVFDSQGRLVGVVSYVRAYQHPGGAELKFMGVLPFLFTSVQLKEAGVV